MRSQTHRVVATALTAGVAVALVPAGAAQAQPVSGAGEVPVADAARPALSVEEAEQNVAAAQVEVQNR
ncbi:MAG: hypothetical protein ACWM0S_07565 [Schaalia turicensis]